VSDADVERASATTLEQMPPDGTQWSTRGLAQAVGLKRTTVAQIWRAFGLQPHRSGTFRLSTGPLYVEKVRDSAATSWGSTPTHPRGRSCGAWTRSPRSRRPPAPRPSCRCVRGSRSGARTTTGRVCVRHGTRDLFAALDVRSGTVIGKVHQRHRSEEFRHVLDTVDANTPPELDLPLILDTAATHQTAPIQRWVLKRRRVHLHFTPTSASWIDRVECWFSLLQRRALERAAFASTDALESATTRTSP
jgi:hypothetical protein